LFVCFPQVSLLHDKRYKQRESRLVKFTVDEGLKVLSLLDELFFFSYNLDRISFFSRGLSIAFSSTIVASFHGDQHLLDFST
jgi:hypothetical protein